MKLLPYCFTQPSLPSSELQATCVWVFLGLAGKRLWQTDEATLSDEEIRSLYCEPNGLPVVSIRRDPSKDLAYVEVHPTQLRLSDFYSWEEALASPEKPECWRRFVFLNDAQGFEWWSPPGLPDAELPEIGSVSSLLSLKTSRNSLV